MYGNYGNDRGGRGGSQGFAPVQMGEEIDVRIEAVGEKGDGIARKRGFVLFVPNTKEGEEVRIRITKVLRKVGFAEVIGPSQGNVGADEEQPAREDQPVAQPEPAHDAPQDSEDFGEEPAPVEAPVEEPVEAPAEEAPTAEELVEEAAEVPAEEAPAEEAPAEKTPAEEPAEGMDVPPPPPGAGKFVCETCGYTQEEPGKCPTDDTELKSS